MENNGADTQTIIIKQAEFVGSAVEATQYPSDGLPLCAMVGKSNVGKSSLINSLVHNRKLARTSGQPGKTRLVNFYRINSAFYLVDLPGYGFAKVSKVEQEKWGTMMKDFFEKSVGLFAIILILDIRHSPTTEDRQVAEWIRHYGIPVLLAASKADKLGKTRLKPQCSQIRSQLGFSEETPIIPYSAVNRRGIEELLMALWGKKEGDFSAHLTLPHPPD